MIKGFHLQLVGYPSFCNFKWFNIKTATAHYSAHSCIIQREVDKLLTQDVMKPLTGSANFYSNMFVVPKHTGGL